MRWRQGLSDKDRTSNMVKEVFKYGGGKDSDKDRTSNMVKDVFKFGGGKDSDKDWNLYCTWLDPHSCTHQNDFVSGSALNPVYVKNVELAAAAAAGQPFVKGMFCFTL